MRTFTLTGKTPIESRQQALKDFQSGDLQVFIAQIATGGVGITLTAADTAIFYSTDFSLANYEQAKARLHRIGQKNSVVDRKSTRLNSSHVKISYAVFCMKKHNI